MKGQLLKDFLNIKDIYKSNLLMIVLFAGIGVYTKNIFYIAFMLLFMGLNMTLSTLSFDQYTKWMQYAIAMPVNRKNIVKAKYAFAGIILLIGNIFSLTISYFAIYLRSNMEFTEILFSHLGGTVFVLFAIAILLPITFKYGIEKARTAIMAVGLIPAMLVFLVVKFLPKPNIVIDNPEKLLLYILIGGVITMIIGFIASIKISEKIVEKMDY